MFLKIYLNFTKKLFNFIFGVTQLNLCDMSFYKDSLMNILHKYEDSMTKKNLKNVILNQYFNKVIEFESPFHSLRTQN